MDMTFYITRNYGQYAIYTVRPTWEPNKEVHEEDQREAEDAEESFRLNQKTLEALFERAKP